MILIVGSSGTLGRVIAKRLLEKNEAVLGMSRTPKKIENIWKMGAEVVPGDLRDPDSLRKASGLNYTIIRPTAFIEFHAHEMIGKPILEKGKVTLFGKGEGPLNFVAIDDVAKYVLLALENQDAQGKTIEIGGADNLSNKQVVSLYERIGGRKAKVRHVFRPVLRMMSRLLRPFHPGVSQAISAGVYFDEHGQYFDMTSTLQQYPMELISLEEWVRSNVTGTRKS